MSSVVKAVGKVVEWLYETIIEPVIEFVGDLFGFEFDAFGATDVEDPGSQATGVTVTKQGTNVALPIVYGHREIGGSVIYAETNGDTNKYLYVVYALCEGDIEGVTKVYVNDELLPNVYKNSSVTYPNGGLIKITSGRFKDRIQMQIFEGNDSQPQSSLADQAATWKKKRRRLPGVAYAVLRYEWKAIKSQADSDNNPFPGGIPQVRFEVLGKRIYDVRRHNIALHGKDINPSTPLYRDTLKRYNFNPANCLFDYLTNPRYGVGLALNEIDLESFKLAANKFEQRVQYSNKQSGRAMTCNAVIDPSKACLDNTKTLLAGCRGIMPFVQGKYKLKVEDGGHPTDISSTAFTSAFDVTKDYVVGGITMSGERKRGKYNQVKINYIDPDKQFTNQQVIFERSGDLAEDNGEPLVGEFTFHTITNVAIARDIAQMIYDKSRKARQINFTATQELLNVEVGDIIRVTDTILDLDQVSFRVVTMQLQNDGNIKIDAVEHDATLYPFTTGPQVEIPAPLFLPDTYRIRPFYRQLPRNPVNVTPIFDPDYDSAGQIIENIDENSPEAPPVTSFPTIPEEIAPEQPEIVVSNNRVIQFEDFRITYDGYYYMNDGTLANPGILYDWLVETPNTSSLIYHKPTGRVQQVTGNGWEFGLYFYEQAQDANSNDYATVYLLMPVDAEIDQLVIRTYNNTDIVDTQVFEVREYPHTVYNYYTNGRGKGRTDIDFTNLYHPIMIKIRLPKNPSHRIRITWRKDEQNLEFPDGSKFPTGQGWAPYLYTNFEEEQVTDDNLEALINYAFTRNVSLLGNSLTTNYDLGS